MLWFDKQAEEAANFYNANSAIAPPERDKPIEFSTEAGCAK
jgi:predicted 3-demethylubiquinone-9 3-methyltransferase (glyoxalase superfamily)